MAQQWKPPSYAIPEAKWEPPDYALTEEGLPEEEESRLGKIYRAATEPPEIVKKFARDVSDWMSRPDPNFAPEANVTGEYSLRDNLARSAAQIRGFFGGATEGAITSFTSPVDIAATATGAGALRTGSKGLKMLTQALSAPIVAHGATNVVSPESSLAERGAGLAEVAGGLLGMHLPLPDAKIPKIREQKLLGPGKTYVSPEGTAYNEGLPIRRSTETPYRMEPSSSRGERPPVNVTDVARREIDDFNRRELAKTRQSRFDRSDVPDNPVAKQLEAERMEIERQFQEDNKPSAKFIGWQEGLPGDEPIALYNVAGTKTEFDGSTVGTDRLKELGIAVPETPAFKAEMRSDVENPFEGELRLDMPDDALPDSPQFARMEGGKVGIGADVQSLGKVLGTSLYKGDIAPIATKELLQNSIDAIRDMGDAGEIRVWMDRAEDTIEVADNGKGLTREEIETVFTDLGASGKRDDKNAVGGFGLAKAAPLLGGKKVEVVSIAVNPKTGKKTEISFKGTPDELLAGVDLNERVAPDDAPTGTKVKVFVPKESDFYAAANFVNRLGENSVNIPGKIKLARTTSGKARDEDFMEVSRGIAKELATIKTKTANTKISIPEDSQRGNRTYIEVNLMNNGMYQGRKTIYLDGSIPNVPHFINVDISSKVKEGHEDYPFTANREELRGSVEETVKKYIDENIVKPSIGKRKAELTRAYNGMTEITLPGGEFPNNFGKKVYLYDPKGQLLPEEIAEMTSNPAFLALASDITDTVDVVMKTLANEKWNSLLERVGIVFDQRLHGVHIPNPETKKSAVMINPFTAIGKGTPDEAAASILHTILHEIAHIEPLRPGHNEDFTVRLAEIYSQYGARKSVQAQDRILKSIADPDDIGGYNQQIQEVLHRYQESRGRDGTTEDLLTGTGIGSKTDGRGKKDIPKGDRPDGKGTPSQRVAAKLIDSLQSSKGLREQQENVYRTERAKRFKGFERAGKEGGVTGARKQLSKLKGEYEKINAESLDLNEAEVDTLFDAVRNAQITTPEKARGYTALFKLLEGGHVPQRSELAILDSVFGNGFAGKIIEMQGGLGAVSIKIAKTANTMKALVSSVDLSSPLRQGVGLIHRKEWRDAFGEMFKYLTNKNYYEQAIENLKKRPTYLLGREAGLFFSEPNSLLAGEEAFLNNYIPHIPIIRDVVGTSERAYTGFLNKLRADTFDNLLKDAKSMGHEAFRLIQDEGKTSIVPSKIADNIAKYINVSTGRGNLGRLEKMAPELNIVLWSPRLLSSRLTILNPKYYVDMDDFTRKQSLKTLLAIAGAGTTMAAIGALAGGKVSMNPLSADFGKVRFGDKVLDPHAGFQQLVVAAAQFLTGQSEVGNQSRATTVGRFAANKLSPMASLAFAIASAQEWNEGGAFTDRFGNETSVPKEVLDRFIPIFVQDLTSLLSEEPRFAEGINAIATGEEFHPENLGFAIPPLFGAGVQDYPERVPHVGAGRLRRMNMDPSLD